MNPPVPFPIDLCHPNPKLLKTRKLLLNLFQAQLLGQSLSQSHKERRVKFFFVFDEIQ